jgi:hypothetical protein
MSDFHTLTDAFTELERRADAATAAHPADPVLYGAPRHRSRPLLIAASVAGVLVIAGGAALLARDQSSPSTSPVKPGGGTSELVSSSTAEPVPAAFQIPQTPDELASRFRTVLGDSATFTVTDTSTGAGETVTVPSATEPNSVKSVAASTPAPTDESTGAAIVGKLTASGVTGGFDLQIYRAAPNEKVWCDDPDTAHCTISKLADGSSLAVGRDPLQNDPEGVTYLVNLLRPDGVEFLMHLSNEPDPKGAGAPLAAHPPLTTDQMTAIVTSDLW